MFNTSHNTLLKNKKKVLWLRVGDLSRIPYAHQVLNSCDSCFHFAFDGEH